MSRQDARGRPGRPSNPSGRDNPSAAAAWLDSVERNIASLGRWPRRSSIIPEAANFDIEYRHLVDAPYRAIFRIVGRRVIIVRLIHGAQLLDLDILDK